jgi:hypothetical protein
MWERMSRPGMTGVVLAAMAIVACGSVAFAETASFQNGVNGYNGTVQIRISTGTGGSSTGGSLNDPDFVMCRMKDWVTDPVNPIEGSMDFWRFDNIVGTSPGQIPPSSTILSARLELRTCSNVTIPGLNPPLPHGTYVLSNGPMCLARMLVPVDETRLTLTRQWGVNPASNNYFPIVSIVPAPNPPLIMAWFDENGSTIQGPDFLAGDFDRPVGGYINMNVHDRVESADVTSIVQEWTNGADNYGFVMFGETTDYWVVEGTGRDYHYPNDVTRRPKLVVEYTPTRTLPMIFQQGTNGYAGCSMLRVGQDGTTLLGDAIDVATNAAYVDGGTGPTDPEFDALVKFDSLFGTGAGQIPPGTSIVKAYLALTTPPESNSVDVHTKGPYTVHRMLVDVDWTGTNHPARPFLWSEFAGGDGPTAADGEIGPELASAQAIAYDGRAFFDVTSAVQAWQNGSAPNYGLVVKPGTTDGWKIHWTGSSSPADLRPQLILLMPKWPSKPADFDGNTFVNSDDLSIFEGCASGPGIPFAGDCAKADFDDDLDVDQSDFSVFQVCYSGDEVAAPACRE